MTGIEIIAEERKRQVKQEGYDDAHDAEHTDGSLAMAAACYAIPARQRNWYLVNRASLRETLWPFEEKYWKPSDDRIRELAKAGALIAAEIDRLRTEAVGKAMARSR